MIFVRSHFRQRVLAEAFFLMGGGWLEGGSRRDVRGLDRKPFPKRWWMVWGGWGKGEGVPQARILKPLPSEGWGLEKFKYPS